MVSGIGGRNFGAGSKLLIAAVLAATVAIAPVHAAEFVPLAQLPAPANQIERAGYAAMRCSGLFNAWGARLKGSGREGIEAVTERAYTVAATFFVEATLANAQRGISLSNEAVMSEIYPMARMYDQLMTDNFARAGNALEGEIVSDFNDCAALYTDIQTALEAESSL